MHSHETLSSTGSSLITENYSIFLIWQTHPFFFFGELKLGNQFFIISIWKPLFLWLDKIYYSELHVKHTCKDFSTYIMIKYILLFLYIVKHPELTRGCWPEKYTNTHLSFNMQNCLVCTLEENIKCLPKATKIYMIAYIFTILVQSSNAVLLQIPLPDCSHLLHTGSAPRVILVHRSTEFPLQGTNTEALLSAHEMHSIEDVTSPNQPLGFWAACMVKRANPRDQVKGSLKFISL